MSQSPNPRSPSLATVRAATLLRLAERLDPADLLTQKRLHRHQLSFAQLSDPYAIVPLARYVALLEDCASLIEEPHLGAQMGQTFRPADLGPLGLIFSLSASLRVAFARMNRYLPAFQTSTSTGLIHAGDHALWAYKINDPRIWPRRQDAEYALSATCQLVSSCMTAPWRPVEVHFEHPAPPDTAPLRRLFGAPLLFDQPANGLLMTQADLDRVNRHEDVGLMSVLERHIQDLIKLDAEPETVSGSVLTLIGIYLGHRKISLTTIAAGLDMLPRTLQRRLADEGTSLRALVQEQRMQMAASQLKARETNMARLAETLGYADSAVFSRAFRHWTGKAPTEVR